MEKIVNKLPADHCHLFLFDYVDIADKKFYDFWHLLNEQLTQDQNHTVKIELLLSDLNLHNLQYFFNLILGLRKIYCKNMQRIKINLINNIICYKKLELDSIELLWSFMVKNLILEQNNYIGFYTEEIKFIEEIIKHIEKTQ